MNQLIVFDLDGTLIDSRKDIADSLNFALKQEGFSTLTQEAINAMVGKGAKQLVEEALGNPKESDLVRVFETFWQHYKENCLNTTALYPGALAFLEKTSHWRRAIITNKPQLFTDKIVQGLNLKKYFSWVIGGDLLPVRKPHPETIAPIHQEFKDYDFGVMVGDSVIDLEFGRAVGLTTCLMSHGFGLHEELLAAQSDYLVKDFEELLKLKIFH